MDRLPGFRDFYPDPLPHKDVWSASVRQHIFATWRNVASRYGFREYDGPPLEPLELYTLKSGAEIVGQLYNFEDKGGRNISLRPEMTPTLARMVAAHERQYKKPIKWFAIPQLFRYERQQRGRLREHFQLNCDIFGETDTAADAELIALLIDTLRALGLTHDDFVIRLSSRNAWADFISARGLTEEQAYAFYQIIDKLERDEPAATEQKLQALGFSRAEVQGFIDAAKPTQELSAILQNLSARGLERYVRIDYNVIRGLAYYTGVVFEAFDVKGEFRAIAGGGRYNNLVKLISAGKVDLPALGFGMGDVVLVELLQERGLMPKGGDSVDAFCIIEDEAVRPASLNLVQHLRDHGFAVEYSFLPAKSDKQFKRAQELNAKHTVRVEINEQGDIQLRLKDLRSREEKLLDPANVAAALRARPTETT